MVEVTSTSAATGHIPCSSAPSTRYHLLTNPTVSGTPIRLRPPAVKAAMVQGIFRPRPRSASICTDPTRYMTQPSDMKSAPFMRAWLKRWSVAAVNPVTEAKLIPRMI